MRGAPDGTLAVMADAWVSLVLRTVTLISRGAQSHGGLESSACGSRTGGGSHGGGPVNISSETMGTSL